MMHDPFQNYATLGQHYGMQAPIGLQYPQIQNPAINPLATLNPLLGLAQLAQTGGIPQFGQSIYGQVPTQGFVNPQQLQLAQLVANNPLVAASLLSNPLVAASLHAQSFGQQQYPQLGQQQYPQLGQQQYPQLGQQIGQPGSPFGQIGYPLAPQSWIGQGVGQFGVGQGFGQRPFQGQGFSPWGY